MCCAPEKEAGLVIGRGKRKMRKQLWKLVLPIAFQQFMLALVSASDVWMLGKLNQDSLSAVSLASQVAFVFNLFMTALVIGTNMFAAQYWGKGDKRSIEAVMAFVMRTTFLIGLLFCTGAVLAPEVLMGIFTNDGKLIFMGAEYLKSVGASYILSGMSQIYLCILKNSGHPGKSMVISSATVVLNIVLNGILIFGMGGLPAMGISGAALATVAANGVGLAWMILESFREGEVRPDRSYYLVGKSINSMTVAGTFCAGGDSRFGMFCDIVTLWGITIPVGLLAAFLWKAPVPAVYFLLNLDEIIKLPAVYRHYKKYKWVRNLTE